ncbi:SLATT domain-containing protein, partial [Vibrio anguillarum]
MKDKESSFRNLYKKMDSTSKTRFNASRRLKLHSKFSAYIIVFISLGLILVTLMQAYSLGSNINNKIVGLFQAFSSIAVLVYSLLIDRNNYSSTSEKMYSCAAQLGELKQEVRP